MTEEQVRIAPTFYNISSLIEDLCHTVPIYKCDIQLSFKSITKQIKKQQANNTRPPLDIYIEGEAKMSAYRMQCNGNSFYHPAMKHTTILDKMRCDILEMPPDRTSGVVDTEIPYIVHLSDRSDWALGEPQQMSNGITWYTDGPKLHQVLAQVFTVADLGRTEAYV
nr:unnamed protein product [Callosobruchus chinensis]